MRARPGGRVRDDEDPGPHAGTGHGEDLRAPWGTADVTKLKVERQEISDGLALIIGDAILSPKLRPTYEKARQRAEARIEEIDAAIAEAAHMDAAALLLALAHRRPRSQGG